LGADDARSTRAGRSPTGRGASGILGQRPDLDCNRPDAVVKFDADPWNRLADQQVADHSHARLPQSRHHDKDGNVAAPGRSGSHCAADSFIVSPPARLAASTVVFIYLGVALFKAEWF
jgi:hypothetical protein